MIGLVGAARAGKDTVAEILVKEFDFTRYAFADSLRDFLLAVNPYLGSNGNHSDVGEGKRLSFVVEKFGWDWSKEKYPEIRRLLQATGTDAARTIFGDRCWIDASFKKVQTVEYIETIYHERDSYSNYEQRCTYFDNKSVFTDVRFANELEAIRTHKMVRKPFLLGINRPNFENGVDKNHASEKSIPELLKLCDHVLVNDSDLETFKNNCRQFFKDKLK